MFFHFIRSYKHVKKDWWVSVRSVQLVCCSRARCLLSRLDKSPFMSRWLPSIHQFICKKLKMKTKNLNDLSKKNKTINNKSIEITKIKCNISNWINQSKNHEWGLSKNDLKLSDLYPRGRPRSYYGGQSFQDTFLFLSDTFLWLRQNVSVKIRQYNTITPWRICRKRSLTAQGSESGISGGFTCSA